VSAKKVVDKSLRYLERHGFDTKPIDHAQWTAKGFDSEEIIWNGLKYREANEIARGNPLSRHGNKVFGSAFIIVSVKPTVIVIAPGLVRAGNIAASDGKIGAISTSFAEEILIGLPGGLVYDNRVPRVGQLLWCSPDLDVSPTPILFDDDGTAIINLPWGQLALVSSGSVYKVSAQRP